MAYEVIVKKRFTNKVQKTLIYLEKEWSNKTAANFLLKPDRKIQLLSEYPFIGVPSSKIKSVGCILITRHNRMYYMIKGDKIIILNIYDTRIKPAKNPYL
jgi:plasmid stabilization system protein ParE